MNIALIGYGSENKSAYSYLKTKFPAASFTIYDQSRVQPADLSSEINFIGGLKDFKDVSADIIVRSPGVSIYKLPENKSVTSATQIFFEQCKAKIIGVTGSKGKGTTCSLIDAFLREAGHTTWLVGNIGKPALDILDEVKPDDIVVYELSSFQLWDLRQSPTTAVILMIEPEHLEVHKDFDDYLAAKANIGLYQSNDDLMVYNGENIYTQSAAIKSSAKKISYPDHLTAHIENDRFYYGKQEICPVSYLQLPGEHNLGNALAAIDAAWPFTSPVAIIDGLKSFNGLPHRLKLVRQLNEIKYYDDSIATTPGSAIAALRSFTGPKVLILGGSSKGADFAELAEVIANNEIRAILLIGSESKKIAQSLDAAGVSDYTLLGSETTMQQTVYLARDAAQAGDIVILSPACASFGMFKNYADRGEQFIEAVESLA